jgi:hypothetical protein
MVFIHGGGQTAGSPHLASYSGEYLAKKGVAFINIAYRLGALGLMVYPELNAENPRRISGNYGAMDMIAALKWISRNIAVQALILPQGAIGMQLGDGCAGAQFRLSIQLSVLVT